MNAQILQNLKNKLRTKYEKVSSSKHSEITSNLLSFWSILQTEKVFISILEELKIKILPEHNQFVSEKLFSNWSSSYHSAAKAKTETEKIIYAFLVIKIFITCKKDDSQLEIDIFGLIDQKFSGGGNVDKIERFVENFIDPIYNFVIEKLDDNVVSLGIFQRYKEKCEWFLGESLQEKIAKYKENYDKKNPDKKNKSYRIEEQVLAPHLYEYLHDQGLEITGKEGQLGNGKYDFRGVDFIGEVKIFGDKAAVIQGFVELLRHLDDANLILGYLVIFNNAEKFLKTPESLQIQDKIIFVITVDIRENKKTPSKDSVNLPTITEDEILKKWDLEKNKKPEKK